MNRLTLTGRPTRDPEIRYSGDAEKEKIIAKFTLASNRIFVREGEATADFIPCAAFGRTAKIIDEYVRKGKHILVSGPIRNNDYINKDGVKIYGFQMTVETVEILEKKNTGPAEPAEDGYLHIDPNDEELPFS